MKILGILNSMKEEQEKYRKLFDRAQAGERPVVLVNACTHGHETVGLRVIEILKEISLMRGTLLFNVANERAKERGIAFTESDLNRSFPGNPDGSYEERLAYFIHPVTEVCDVVIDIHSTETTDPGKESVIIVTKLDAETRKITDVIHPPRVLVMECTKNNALISDAKIGIGFEYGKNDHPETLRLVVRDIKKLLMYLSMIDVEVEYEQRDNKTRYYRVFDVMKKIGDTTMSPTIQNYSCIRKGQSIGNKNGEPFLAPCDFVPILFGKNRYKDIFGLMGREI